jgi:O-antigen/teichoic acid export membrane protein
MALTEPPPELAPPPSGPPPSGARSGALLAAATAVSILAAYAFLLAAGRILGTEDYGSFAALLGLLTIILIPAGALQMAVSREVSRSLATGDERGAARLAGGTLRASAVATVPLVVVMLLLSPVLSRVLNINSTPAVVIALLSLLTALVYPVAMGVLQGEQRFVPLASLYVIPWAVRLVVLGIAAAAGARLGGAVSATLAGALVSMAVAYALIRPGLRGADRLSRADLRSFLVYLWPVAVALIGIALLTNVDVLIVKARFSGHEAGAYAAASAFARVGFFLPAAILTVLFPRTAARQARGEETEDILGRSLFATAGFCGLLALVYAAAGTGLVTLTYGAEFAKGGDVLAPFALAMGLFSLANVLVGYHLSRGETRYAWIVAGAVVVQVAALSTIPSSLEGVVWTNVVVGVLLLAAHEVAVGSSAPALRAAVRRVPARTWSGVRAVTVETVLVLIGCTVFICVLMWPVVLHLGSTIIGTPGSDSTGSVSFFWMLTHESGFHLLGTTHHTLSGAPFGWDEGNGLNIQWSLPYYPTYLATRLFGPVFAYNLVTLAGYILSGASMYLLARYLRCSRLVAVWAAFVFMIFPWHFARAEHASLTHLEVLALLILALVAAARNPDWLRFGFVGLATLACWLTSGYFGGMAVITVVAFSAGTALIDRTRRGVVLAGGAIGATVAASLLVAIGSYASGVNAGAGIQREADALRPFGLRLTELVIPPPHHLFFHLDAFWSRHMHGSPNFTEITNDLGLVTFVLAIVWLVVVVRRRNGNAPLTAGLVAAFVVGVLFALPSPIAGIPMPSKLLWDVLPAFRVPSRWDPLLMSAVLPLAALGLQTARRRLGVAVVVAAFVLSFVELSTHRVAHFRTVPVPPEYASLKADTTKGIVAEYPLGYSDLYRLWQRIHGRPLVNGAPEGSLPDEAHLMLLDPKEPGVSSALSLLGVTAIVLHPGGPADVPVQPREPTAADGFRLVGRFPDTSSVWAVTAPPAPAFVMYSGGFAVPRRLDNGTLVYPMVASGGVAVMEIRSRKPQVVRVEFDAGAPGGQRNLTLQDAQGDHPYGFTGSRHFGENIEVPRGVSQLIFKVDQPPASEADAIVLTQPHVGPAAGAATLHGIPVSDDPGF